MPGKPNVMTRCWKKIRKNGKRTNTSSSADTEREASSTSESGFEDSVDMESSTDNTDIEDENNIHEAPEEISDQYLDSCRPRGTQKDIPQ